MGKHMPAGPGLIRRPLATMALVVAVGSGKPKRKLSSRPNSPVRVQATMKAMSAVGRWIVIVSTAPGAVRLAVS